LVDWRPLHDRDSDVEEQPHQGVPRHLSAAIWDWVEHALRTPGRLYDRSMVQRVGVLARVPLGAGRNTPELLTDLKASCLENGVVFLSVVDAVLATRGGAADDQVERLRELLHAGHSAWSVGPDGTSLARRVDPAAAAAAAQAIGVSDPAAAELAEAWRNAFGRHPDPSDAWDHAIKAVEHVLKPVVCPDRPRATLGNVVGDLRAQDRWQIALPGRRNDHNVDHLVAILDVLWPNPDRHGGIDSRPVSLDQARAVVHLAVTIVQWGRAGIVHRIRTT
jgi:hypothetical protein